MFNKLISRTGIDRGEVRIDNVIRCQPPGDWLDGAPWEADATAHCSRYLDETLKEPHKVVVALGSPATRRLLGLPRNGHVQANWHGSAIKRDNQWVVPTLHPSFLLRGNQKLIGSVCYDLQVAKRVAREGSVVRSVSLRVDPPPTEFDSYIETYLASPDDSWLAVDIETTGKGTDEGELDYGTFGDSITRINFSYNLNEGLTVPFSGQYLSGIQRLLRSGRVTCWWNSRFDVPRLRAAGIEITGTILDFMWGWHVLQSDLPRGLGFVAPFYSDLGPWKHLSSTDPGTYAAIDAVQTLRLAHGIAKDLQASGQWDIFWRHITDLDRKVLFPAEKIGLKVDVPGLEAFRKKLQDKENEITQAVQALVPKEICTEKVWVRRPEREDIYEKPIIDLVGVCRTCGAKEVQKRHRCADKKLSPRYEISEERVVRWATRLPFNPASGTQVLAYIESKGLKGGKAKKSKTNKPSTDKKTIEALFKKTKDPFYSLILQHRDVGKVLGTYVEGTYRRLGYEISEGEWRSVRSTDERLHPSFLHKPSTLRLSCVGPNLQNVRNDENTASLANGFRSALVAAAGCVLLELDFSAIEAVETGWFAGDPTYIRLSKLGVHDYLTSHLIGRPADLKWSDKDLGAYFKEIKAKHKADRDRAKRVVHGCLPGDHCVLTKGGWVRLDQLKEGQQVAQWNDGEISFVTPEKITRVPCQDDEMIQLSGRGLQVQMTLDHRVPVRTSEFGKAKEFRAAALPQIGRIPVSGDYNLSDYATGSYCPPYIPLAVAIQADATLYGNHVVFHLVKERKKERLRELLAALRIPVTESACACHSTGTRFGFYVGDIEGIAKLLHFPTKTFSLSGLLDLSYTERRAFLAELSFWDGCRGKNRTTYLSTNKMNIVTVQTIAHMTGIQSLVRLRTPGKGQWGTKPVWECSFNRRRWSRIETLEKELIPAVKEVFCVTVPSTFFLTRWRETISVTGNTNYGLTPIGMVNNYPGLFTRESAAKLQALYFDLCPKLHSWQKSLRDRAHKQNYLGGEDHPFRYKHWFWQVYVFNSKTRNWSLGEDSKRVVAFYPQSTAAGVIKEACLRLMDEEGESYIGDSYYGQTPIRALVHDSILMEVPLEKVDYVVERAVREMTRAIIQQPNPLAWNLGEHLVIDVAGKIGKTWGEMSELKLPELGTASDTAVVDEEEEEELAS